MKFADVLKQERDKAGLTQAALADQLSVAKSTVSMWEQGKRVPPLEKLEEIADFFNINLDRLRGGASKGESIQNIAAHATKDLTDEEAEKILEFAKFLKSQRKK